MIRMKSLLPFVLGLLGAGFAIQCGERFSTYFDCDGELGRRNYQSTNVTGGFRLAF